MILMSMFLTSGGLNEKQRFLYDGNSLYTNTYSLLIVNIEADM